MSEGISLGWNCYSTSYAVDNGIRKLKANGYKTCVFDTMLSNYDGIVKCIETDFKYFTDPEYLEIIKIPSSSPYLKNENILYNKYYKFIFNHESPGHADLYLTERWPGGINHYIHNNYQLFIERYNRRIQNFRDYLNSGSEITFVITYPNDNLEELKNALTNAYPNLKYKIVRLDVQNQQHYEDHLSVMYLFKCSNDN